ncbi:MAG TPA: SAP domain-containing protein, partial [Nannocystaceae bacterium]|nr:SAP domain-containing protein [Nannocystaceae bacterium]
MAKPSKRSVLGVLTRQVLLDLADAFAIEVARAAAKPDLIDALAAAKRAPLPKLLDRLRREDLKEICRAHGLDDSGREKALIRERILAGGDIDDADDDAHPSAPAPAPAPPHVEPALALHDAQLTLEVAAGPLTLRRILEALDAPALVAVAAHFGFAPGPGLVDDMVESGLVPLREILEELPLQPLQHLARAHGADGRIRTRERLVAHLLERARHPGTRPVAPPSAPSSTLPASPLPPDGEACPEIPAKHATEPIPAPVRRPRTRSEAPAAASLPTSEPPTASRPLPAPEPLGAPDTAPRRPSERTVLADLPRDRLIEVARVFNIAPRPRLAADALREHLLLTARPTVADLLQHLTRDELRQICERHGLDATGRARAALVARILHARGEEPPAPAPLAPSP